MKKRNKELLGLLEDAHELASGNENGAHNEDTRNIAVAIGVVKRRLKYLESQNPETPEKPEKIDKVSDKVSDKGIEQGS